MEAESRVGFLEGKPAPIPASWESEEHSSCQVGLGKSPDG